MNTETATGCFNCTKFVEVGTATNEYRLGYCNKTETGNWLSNVVKWDNEACASYEKSEAKEQTYIAEGNTING